MPNLLKTLKQEISRIAKREAKQMVSAQAKITSDLKRKVTDLKKQVKELEKSQKTVEKAMPEMQPEIKPADSTKKATGKWFTGQGIQSIRTRLELTQPTFAKLFGVSASSITKWENTKGKVGLKAANRDTLTALRTMPKKEVWKKLGLEKGETGSTVNKTSENPQSGNKTVTGQDIQALRKRLGLSQKALGQKLGYSQKGISHWELKKGPISLPPKTLEAIAKLEGEMAEEKATQ